jgi:hypothetical protein
MLITFFRQISSLIWWLRDRVRCTFLRSVSYMHEERRRVGTMGHEMKQSLFTSIFQIVCDKGAIWQDRPVVEGTKATHGHAKSCATACLVRCGLKPADMMMSWRVGPCMYSRKWHVRSTSMGRQSKHLISWIFVDITSAWSAAVYYLLMQFQIGNAQTRASDALENIKRTSGSSVLWTITHFLIKSYPLIFSGSTDTASCSAYSSNSSHPHEANVTTSLVIPILLSHSPGRHSSHTWAHINHVFVVPLDECIVNANAKRWIKSKRKSVKVIQMTKSLER